MIKKITIYITTLLTVLLVLPALIVTTCRGPKIPRAELPEESRIKISVFFHRENKVREMCLEEYVVGVVAGEMPASFEIEALKAQAIIARTYAFSRMRQFGGPGYDGAFDADICDNFRHSQHFVTKEEAKANWSYWQRNSNWNKIVEAVFSTAGIIITHNGRAIDALYHSTCGGFTENSEDVFTNAIPYLRGVKCKHCQNSSRLNQQVTYTKEEFISILEREDLQGVVGATQIHMAPLSKTTSGRIIQYRIGDRIFRGSEVRSLFDLNSARFSFLFDGNNITFKVVGYGHGVGMCQFGSNGLAKKGYNYEEIIKFYYTDVEIINIGE